MFHFENSQLRVCGRIVRQQRNNEFLKKSRFIILQHILWDTYDLLKIFKEADIELHAIIAKPYSIDEEVEKKMLFEDFPLKKYTYNEMETTNVLDEILDKAINKSKKDNKKIIIIEVGGYFANVLTKISKKDANYFAGVVEDTTFGYNRYLKFVKNINIPVFSVARSPLKEIEAIFVGRAAVLAVDNIFREIGISMPSRRALVIGYGMIGKNVAFALKAHNLNVSVYDKNDHRNLKAFNMGFRIHKKLELIKEADIIFSATGTNAVTIDDIEMCKSDVVLASVGSKDIEFDIQGIRDLAIKKETINKHVVKYIFPSNKTVYVLSEGTAVNFIIKSVPTEIIDIVFSEILLCTILLLKTEKKYLPSLVHTLPETYLNQISKDWLKNINH